VATLQDILRDDLREARGQVRAIEEELAGSADMHKLAELADGLAEHVDGFGERVLKAVEQLEGKG
jgi:hypothetical protein